MKMSKEMQQGVNISKIKQHLVILIKKQVKFIEKYIKRKQKDFQSH